MAEVEHPDADPGVLQASVAPKKGLDAFVSGWRSMAVGLGITARRASHKPTTLRYPFEKLTMSPRWRGALRLRGVLGRDDVALVTARPPHHNELIAGLLEVERLPPCVGTCPANVDARGQNYLIADGRVAEAYELVRERNIMPGVLGRICHHPCEGACTRARYDQPIAIRPLHRFAQETYAKVRTERVKRLPVSQGAPVAIIGSGPSGLAAALDLMRLGYAVTMFEKYDKPGGALYSGVPAYRLPREVLHSEIDDLVTMGLDLRCGVEVGRDISLAELRQDFGAVLIAAGLQVSRILPIPGADAEGVRGALEFLRAANWENEAGVRGKRVLVIGGGNVAVDVARCALRVGATEVRMASLESMEEVPAHPWEIEEALDEGVIATCSVGPEEVAVEDGHVVGLRVRECLSVFDETGRFAPKMGENTHLLETDVVVFAIGQAAVLDDVVKDSDVTLNERGNLKVDGTLFTTTGAGVFASGEGLTGPGSASASIATGHEAAQSIHRFLQNVDIAADRTPRPVPVFEKYAPAQLDGVEADRLRATMSMADPVERITDFRPIESGLENGGSQHEAARCLRCDSEVCVGCTFCARTCPDFCIKVERVDTPGARCVTAYDLDLSKCCFCGLCAEQCPTKALTHTGQYELSFYHRDLALFDKGEMLRDPLPSRATGRDGIEAPACGVPAKDGDRP
jgi:NADPH-dependent glutamate synthase beta subunit-like oxidoreductase/NAD-dependent dihydropyrimidine dehydrogenase PreA subunit